MNQETRLKVLELAVTYASHVITGNCYTSELRGHLRQKTPPIEGEMPTDQLVRHVFNHFKSLVESDA